MAPAARVPGLGRQWFAVLGAMLAWGADFLLRYGISWSACAGGWAEAELLGMRLVHLLLVLLTVLTGAVAVAATIEAWRIWRGMGRAAARDPPDRRAEADPFARSRFMAIAGLTMGALSLYGILLQALPGLFLPACG